MRRILSGEFIYQANFNFESYRETYPDQVAAIEAFIRQQTAGVASGEDELPILAEENRALFAQLLQLQQEIEKMQN
ncbi:MAG: hypothetical protein KDD06_17235 [Phaeodactylibacter sp.]|nr:hypothetical protein [Phaeodactylibacter sp.]